MAREITSTDALSVNSLSLNHSNTKQIDQATAVYGGGVQNVGTTQEAVGIGEVVTPGVAFFKNLDPTNFVEIGVMSSGTGGTFLPLVKCKPGESAKFRLATANFWARANTASVNLQTCILAD
jgi:hypothetical protein